MSRCHLRKRECRQKNICKDWNNGDVFRYDWSSPETLPPELASKTLYVQRIGTYHAGRHTDPIVWFKLSSHTEHGDCLDAFRRAEFLPMYTFTEAYLSMERISPESERAEYAFHTEQQAYSCNQKLQVLAYRCWFEVRKTDLKRFHFIGNDASPGAPSNEFIPRFAVELELLLSNTLEQDVLSAYLQLKKYT